VGRDAVQTSGMQSAQLAGLFRDLFHQFIDGGANIVNVASPNGGEVRIYVRRRGRSLDVGTRQDFLDLGWGVICDALDRTVGGDKPS
jgi:hypothetical protein